MITQAHGWDALFSSTDSSGKTFPDKKPVVCWVADSDGRVKGYVNDANRYRKGLSCAEDYSNFEGYELSEQHGGTVIPAVPGWWIVERFSEDPPSGAWDRVIAWVVFHNGEIDQVKALPEPDADGSTFLADPSEKVRFIYDPNHEGWEGPWPLPLLKEGFDAD